MRVTFENQIDAVNEWIKEFNVVPTMLVENISLFEHESTFITEVTLAKIGDEVSFLMEFKNGENKVREDILTGIITDIDYENNTFDVEVEEFIGDKELVVQEYIVPWKSIEENFNLQNEDTFPLWNKMYMFDSESDSNWIEDEINQVKMAQLGFRIYFCDILGYVFGFDIDDESADENIDLAKEYWEPLYEIRGLNWYEESLNNEE